MKRIVIFLLSTIVCLSIQARQDYKIEFNQSDFLFEKKGDLIKKPKLRLTTSLISLDNPKAYQLAHDNFLIDAEEEIYLTDGKPGILAYNDCCMAVLCNPKNVDVTYNPRHGHNMIKVAYSQMSNKEHKMLAWLSPVGIEPKIIRGKIFRDLVCRNMGSRARLEKNLPRSGFRRVESNQKAVDTMSFDW